MAPLISHRLGQTRRKSQRGSEGFLMMAGILAALGMVLGTVALVNLNLGRLRGSKQLSDSRDAKSVAEAGLNQILATLNRPENRGLLVAGIAMGQWSNTANNNAIRSPCVNTSGVRPGASGDGIPTSSARTYGDGQYRDVETGAIGTGTRRFSLRSITYATGNNGASDRRALRVTTTASNNTLNTVGTFSKDLINLDDPDGTGSLTPGYNTGTISITVEGMVVQPDGSIARSLITREFSLIPKCCGASFGSNGSGGASMGSSANSLGSDSRYCSVDFGVITGLNGGNHWTLYANDSYTTRNSSGQIIPLTTIIGDTTGQTDTRFSRANCRVIPCNLSTGTDRTYWGYLNSAAPGGVYGTANDIAGTTISGINVIPASINLPAVTSYNFTWSAAVSAQTRENYTSSEYLRTNRTRMAVERRFPSSSTCNAAYGSANCVASGTYYWGKIPSCEYTLVSPVNGTPGFHCKGPSIDFASSNSAQTINVDTSDGPLSYYYNTSSGWAYTNSTQELILLGTGDLYQHVECASLSTNCQTPVSDLTFSALGQPDRLNIFGNPYSASYPSYLQHIYLNATSSGSTDPGKITGVFIYLPTGFLELNAALGGSCVVSNPNCWNVNGRIWVRSLKAFGDLAFRVPPSTGNFVLNSTTNPGFKVVPWTGTDWVARSIKTAGNY